MIYKIKRFSFLRLEEKEFAFNNFSDFISKDLVFQLPSLDILKLLEMYDLDQRKHVEHWLDMTAQAMSELSQSNIPPQVSLFWIEENDNLVSSTIGSNNLKFFRENYGKPLDFLNHLLIRLKTESKSEDPLSPKYKKWFKDNDLYFNNDIEIYISVFKYIALCISGQLIPNEEPGDFYTMINNSRFRNMKINYKVNKKFSKQNLINIINKCVKDIKYIYE